jgi:hypothetical protein
MERERRIVDDRTFLLGLDGLYRKAMKRHESQELIHCARVVAGELSLPPAEGPVEGYYVETPELTEYFQLVRALQGVGRGFRDRLSGLLEFQRLEEVVSAPLFGKAIYEGLLLPEMRDPLYLALQGRPMEGWSIDSLVDGAHRAAVEEDDFSLVGMAALARDGVVLTAARESTVLFAGVLAGSAPDPPEPVYVWAVDPELSRRAGRFVGTFKSLFGEDLPLPVAGNAAAYWASAEENEVMGRCVRIGKDDSRVPVRHYHWAIRSGMEGKEEAVDFWDDELWTTARYREKIGW